MEMRGKGNHSNVFVKCKIGGDRFPWISRNRKIIIGKVENELVKLKSSTIESSILVVSTHEKASENFIFKYLIEKNIYPKYIISDNVNLESSYKFYLENTKKYKNQIFIFNDKNNFFKSLYCGLSIRS